MNYEELYDQTINKLKKNERPKILLTVELKEVLKKEWQKAIQSEKINELAVKKILCILDNSQNMTPDFNDLFIATLAKIKNKDLIIYALAATHKHIISESQRSGNLIANDYMEQLKILLKNKNPEIVEWTLRTIDLMGPLSLRFVSEVRAIKPGIKKFVNLHHRSSAQLISIMEKQWEKMRT